MQSIFNTLAGTHDDTPAVINPLMVLNEVYPNTANAEAWRHPLGFVHVELTSMVNAPAKHRFRLHIWDNDAGTIDDLGDLHDHVWDLKSWVMLGRLVDKTYAAVRSDAGTYLGSRICYGEVNTASAKQRYDLVPLMTREIQQGNIYTIPYGTVHSSTVATVPTLTLLVSVENEVAARRGPLVLTQDRPIAGVTGVRVRLSAAELIRTLDSATNAVGHNGGEQVDRVGMVS